MRSKAIPPVGYRRKSLPELLKAIDDCQSISQLCALVQHEHIVIQMKSQQAASNIPYRELPKNPQLSPVESLRAQIREAAIAMDRQHSKEELIRAIETCPSIDKLFELVKNEHIVIRMRSQQAASCLPRHRFTPDELMPDTTPLERLRQQVLDAVIYGG